MLREWMTGEVEAEDFFLHRELFFLLILGAVWQRLISGRSRILFVSEEPALAAFAIGKYGGAALHGAIDRGHHLGPISAQHIECAGLDERLDGRPAASL